MVYAANIFLITEHLIIQIIVFPFQIHFGIAFFCHTAIIKIFSNFYTPTIRNSLQGLKRGSFVIIKYYYHYYLVRITIVRNRPKVNSLFSSILVITVFFFFFLYFANLRVSTFSQKRE